MKRNGELASPPQSPSPGKERCRNPGSWEMLRNPLNRNSRFGQRLGEKDRKINSSAWTLTPLIRVRFLVPQPPPVSLSADQQPIRTILEPQARVAARAHGAQHLREPEGGLDVADALGPDVGDAVAIRIGRLRTRLPGQV